LSPGHPIHFSFTGNSPAKTSRNDLKLKNKTGEEAHSGLNIRDITLTFRKDFKIKIPRPQTQKQNRRGGTQWAKQG
jgi:hypothetical protein